MYLATVREYEAWSLLEQEDGARDTDPALRQVDEAMQTKCCAGNETSGTIGEQLFNDSTRREVGADGE